MTPFDKKGEGLSLFGVREFQQSDNPKRIHWKISAKRSGVTDSHSYMVKQMESEEQPVVRLSIHRLPSNDMERFDDIVGYTWSLYQYFVSIDGQVEIAIQLANGWKK